MIVKFPDNFVCGVCTGIPACCIKFHLKGSDKYKRYDGSGNNPRVRTLFRQLYGRKKVLELRKFYQCGGLIYVVCPTCLREKRVVKPKSCWTADGKEPLWRIDPSYPCPLRRGGPIPNWNRKYEQLMQSIFEPYEEGSPLEKGWCFAEFN